MAEEDYNFEVEYGFQPAEEDYNFEVEYGFQPEEQQYENEYRVFERAGYGQTDVERVAEEAGVAFTFKKGDVIRDPVQRFYVYVDATARKLINERVLPNLATDEIPSILSRIQDVKNVKYKNADAFVIGYALAKGDDINKKLFRSLLPKLKEMDPEIKSADAIRYARLWINLNK
jgi:hypothetical protein